MISVGNGGAGGRRPAASARLIYVQLSSDIKTDCMKSLLETTAEVVLEARLEPEMETRVAEA